MKDTGNKRYLFQSGNLKLNDGNKFRDVLCIEVNETTKQKRGIPAVSFLFLDSNVKPFSVRIVDIHSFKCDRIPVGGSYELNQ